MRIRERPSGQSTRTLNVSVEKPRGVAIRSLSDVVTLRGAAGERTVRHPADLMQPADTWWIILDFDVTDLGDFMLVLPPFVVDAQRFDPQPVQFELRRHDWAVYPFNC